MFKIDLIWLFNSLQIEKAVLFILEQQGLFAGRISSLGERQEALQERPDILSISELREAYRDIGRDLLKLLFFIEINAIGLRKILKKIDKRFGYKFTNYYVKTRANHPYSQLQQVFKHVVIRSSQYFFNFPFDAYVLPFALFQLCFYLNNFLCCTL